ncbi:hypothetical protein [Burkholderia sp. Bp8984]|uniref:hypothetical protein n=1 Tax=Burkholderia sp. Bp8984 TaxID=2184549 RepID=UPI0021AB50D1|nr:hypothetical protein [Burkholderia sp. Bp8984]
MRKGSSFYWFGTFGYVRRRHAPGGATAGGGFRQVAVIVAERPRRVKPRAAPGNLAFSTETRDNPLARERSNSLELSPGARATADYHAVERRIRRNATLPAHRPMIAALRQAATNLKKLEQWPSGAHPAAPAFRDSARRARAAARARTQEARRR